MCSLSSIKENSLNKKSRRFVMGKAGLWASHNDSHRSGYWQSRLAEFGARYQISIFPAVSSATNLPSAPQLCCS